MTTREQVLENFTPLFLFDAIGFYVNDNIMKVHLLSMWNLIDENDRDTIWLNISTLLLLLQCP